MKRAFILFAALLMSAPIFAQSQVKVDKDAVLKKIAKSDADIANPKKATSAKVWMERGKTFYEAQSAYSSNIYDGLDATTTKLMLGEPKSSESFEAPNGQKFTKNIYDNFATFSDENGRVRAWEVTNEIFPNATDKSLEAYAKAYELDAKQGPKIGEGVKSVTDMLLKDGGCAYVLAQYGKAGDDFKKVWEVSNKPFSATTPDTTSVYNAGLAYLFAEDYPNSYACFTEAQTLGYEQNGEIYYLLYHSYKNQFQSDTVKLSAAEPMLMTGLTKYPENTKIIECLTDLYVSIGKDPEAIVPKVEAAIAKDPKNASLWNGLGRIYDKLGNLEKSVEAFEKVAELLPDNAIAQYSVGLLYIRMADQRSNDLYGKTSYGTDEYEAENKAIMDTYAKSIAPLEKAHELNGNEPAFVELLKNVYFRLRDVEGTDYMAQYEKYKALWDQIQSGAQQ